MLVLTWGAAAVGLGLWAVAHPPWNPDQVYFLVDTADALVYGLTAAVVLGRRTHAVAWLVALCAVGGGAAAVVAQLAARYGTAAPPPAWGILQGTAWVPGTLSLILVVPYLLGRERPSRAAYAAVGAGVAVIAALLAVRLTDPWPWPAAPHPFAPLAVRSAAWARLAGPLADALVLAVIVLGLAAAAHAALRRHRDPSARGLGWLAIGTALIALTFVPLVVRPEGPGGWPELLTPVTHLASQAFFPAAVLVVVLRQRLWGIDLVISRTLVWALLTGLLIGGCFAALALLGALLPGSGTLGAVLATAATAAGIQPARGWLQRRVDRLVHGEAAAPALSRVGRHLGSAATPEEALAGMAESVAASFNLGSVRVLGPDGRVLAAAGEPDEPAPLELPLVVRQETAGTLRVTARPGEALDRRARAALDEVAPLLGTAVQIAAVTRALRESRGRLAAARDDERRALRRELHDGLGPALAGVGLGLSAARNLLPPGAGASDALLAALRTEVDHQVEAVRVLARGLVPPVLAELGLVPALRELVMRYESDGLAVVVRDAGAGEPEREVAGAVYAVVAEAIRNVARHSGARVCAVELAGDRGALAVTVEDDGRGIGPGARPGVGTQSLRERAELVGGTVAWGPGSGGRGTRLELRIPARPEGAAA
ncbi:sensor histidine kinase [Streptomyces sp. NPDC101118]|uniref:sensor histidine kinase n=1 Tax=Streptomyces sp. NPDC101118 TaxID=3366109 RepID=UPI003803E83A